MRRDEEGRIKIKDTEEVTTVIASETEINTLDEYRQELREIVNEFNEKIKLGE